MIRFRVTRTSNYSVYEMDQQPCEEAFADGEGWFLLIESLEAWKSSSASMGRWLSQ